MRLFLCRAIVPCLTTRHAPSAIKSFRVNILSNFNAENFDFTVTKKSTAEVVPNSKMLHD